MKGSQLTFVLIALIALGIVGVAARLVTATETKELALRGVPSLTEDVVDKVVMRSIKHDTTTTVRLVDEQWMAGPYPAAEVQLQLLWDTTRRFEGSDLIATDPINHALMGVDAENGTMVQFWSGDQLIEEIIVGDSYVAPPVDKPGARAKSPWTERTQLCYLRYEGKDEVYGVHCPFPERFNPHISWWADPIIFEMPVRELAAFSYSYPDGDFDLDIVNRRWHVVVDGVVVEEQADSDVMNALIEAVTRFISSRIPTEEEVAQLDFTRPDVTMWIRSFPDGTTESVLLLLIEKEEGSYYVKDATKSYVYFLEQRHAATILKTMAELLPLTTANATTTPSG